ncbi:MAG: polysaccharide deacetylase [Ruminococcaceae bacterium]|nr:polysaccharide deacetylase [Oscillospiraceae bacterium]
MKKIYGVILTLCIILLSACGGNNSEVKGELTENYESTTNEFTETTTMSETTEATEATEAPSPEGMGTITRSKKSVYGKRTGTKETYTGLEPLEEVKLPIVDVDNLKKLSEKSESHSYGVSKNGVPHEISVNYQKIYDKYNALCLDTSGEKVIYLTFDCGYENGCTAQILDVLKEKGVPAAFFVTLPYLQSAPEVAARMINEGHIVGNHSDTHPNFSTISRTQMAKEIETVDNYLRVHFGYSSPYFRFPQGAYSESALDLVNNAGYTSVFWSSAYADWDTNNQKGKPYAYETVTARLHPGCVLLLHAVSQDNADALGDIIDYAREQGYEFRQLP